MPFSCNFAFTVGLKTAPDCEELDYNVFRLTNPFNQDRFLGDLPISIIFRDRVLPGANLMIKGITIQMVKTLEETDYVVDELVDEALRPGRPADVDECRLVAILARILAGTAGIAIPVEQVVGDLKRQAQIPLRACG